jgi:hypothetical protein
VEGLGTCLAAGDAGGDGEGVHVLVVADRGLRVGVGVVGGVRGGGVRVGVGREHGVCGRLGEPWRRSRVVIIGGGGEDGEWIGRTILCSDVLHRTRCDTSAGAQSW